MRLRACALAFAALAALATLPAAQPKPAPKPQVAFTTTLGRFTVELDPDAAPATTTNFLNYVNSGQYKGTTFHRVIAKFMIQGGGINAKGVELPTKAPIRNEAERALGKGLKNVRGAVAMARTSDPHSATAQFFINVVDNAFLDFPGQDGWGYCVFGRVVQGMDTVDRIRDVKTGPADDPLQPVVITDAKVVKVAAKP
jgi:cyclophilin family peptidyl-prolyl cis-trans isomerase